MSEQSKYLSKQCLSALKINTQTKYTYTYRKDSNPYLRASVCYLQNQMKSSGSNQSFCTHHSPLDGAVTSRHRSALFFMNAHSCTLTTACPLASHSVHQPTAAAAAMALLKTTKFISSVGSLTPSLATIPIRAK